MTGVPTKAKSATSLASGSLASVIWYLMERASFSSISAFSRSTDEALRLVLPFDGGGDDLVEGRAHAEELERPHHVEDVGSFQNAFHRSDLLMLS